MTQVHVITHPHLLQQHIMYPIMTEVESLQNYMRPFDKDPSGQTERPVYATHAHCPDWLDLDKDLLLF
jgi:hypothetical protein